MSIELNANVDLVVQDLTNQVAKISREKAFYFALAIENQEKVKELQEEINQLKETTEK